MIAGRKPYYGSRSEVLNAQLQVQPPTPSEFAYVSPDLERIILKAIAKQPSERYQAGAKFAQALDEAELVPAPAKNSLTTRLFGWMRRGS